MVALIVCPFDNNPVFNILGMKVWEKQNKKLTLASSVTAQILCIEACGKTQKQIEKEKEKDNQDCITTKEKSEAINYVGDIMRRALQDEIKELLDIS